jgi:cytochrome c553
MALPALALDLSGPGTVSNAATASTAATASISPASLSPAIGAPGSGETADELARRFAACTACHGPQGRASPEGYLPRIAGKPAGYLYNQLRQFREGRRAVPVMTWMVDRLPDAYLLEMAQYFAAQHPPYPRPQIVTLDVASRERGRLLVTTGDASRSVPACTACHGKALLGAQPAIPGLLGLPQDYLNAQLGAWREGVRNAVAPDCMATIAKRLAPRDIAAITGWLASQPVPAGARAAAALPAAVLAAEMPLECGGLTP